MYYLLLLALLGFNFFISWRNAKTVGAYWSESKQVGGMFRAEIICGYIQAIAGFTMVYSYILLLIAPFVMQAANADPELIADFEVLAGNLVYLLVAIPIVGSGFLIWFRSLRTAWEQRSLSTIAVAGYNSFAQIHNTISLARNAPSAIKSIGGLLGGDKKRRSRSKNDGQAALILLALIVVVLAILGGYFTANYLVHKADEEFDGCQDFLNNHPEYRKARA